MFKDVPNASDRCKLCEKYVVNPADQEKKIFEEFNRLLVQWAKAENTIYSKHKTITVPIFASIDKEHYDQIRVQFEEKGYTVINNGGRLVISQPTSNQ